MPVNDPYDAARGPPPDQTIERVRIPASERHRDAELMREQPAVKRGQRQPRVRGFVRTASRVAFFIPEASKTASSGHGLAAR